MRGMRAHLTADVRRHGPRTKVRAWARRLMCAWVALTPPVAHAQASDAALRVQLDGVWREIWRAQSAPHVYRSGDSTIHRALTWTSHGASLRHGELRLSGAGEAWRLRAIVVELMPTQYRARLAFGQGRHGYLMRVNDISEQADLAVNTGMFEGTRPWGWVRQAGKDQQRPRRAPLAIALAFDSAGRPFWIDDDAAWSDDARLTVGFQSYPLLLRHDTIPATLSPTASGIRAAHRDARLAVGTTRDGRLRFVLTRFDALGETFGRIPVGLTLPELAALMGMLGCETAVALDGGSSAQLAFRDSAGTVHAWPGLRAVPMMLRFDAHPTRGDR